MIIIVKLNEEQWEKINDLKRISSYGVDYEFFNSIEEAFGDKVVTLNAFSMWKRESAKNPPEKRIELYHIILELPNGKFTVSSQTFNKRYLRIHKDGISILVVPPMGIDKDQIKYYDIPAHQIYENKTLNYPPPESVRGRMGQNIVLL